MAPEELASWALGHGFADAGGGRYETFFKGATVSLNAGPVWVETRIEMDGRSEKLARASWRNLHVDQDLLMGVGLGMSFLMRFAKSADDRPPWVSSENMKLWFTPLEEQVENPGGPRP